MVKRYKIADIVFDAQFLYAYTPHICKEFLYSGKESPKFFIDITKQAVENEYSPDNESNLPEFLESIAFFRALLDNLLEYNAIVFHSSVVAVNGYAYMFTAPSGTGKSTHTRLWRELLKDKAVMINDDKPIIRFVDGEFYVYGSPFKGKHSLGENTKAKIKAICKISQAKENSIVKTTSQEILPTLLNQTLRPDQSEKMDKLISIIINMLNKVSMYHLKCNTDISSARLSYQTMSGVKNED